MGKKIMDAPVVFGTTINNQTPIVIVPRVQHWLRLKIPIGVHAIVSRRGASQGVYKPGSYIRPLFYRVDYLVTTHHIPYHFHVNSCPTKDNVLINLAVDFLLHVEQPEVFVYSIGPENMEELLRATQAESVRTLVRGVNVHDAYDLRGYESDEMLKALNDKMNPYGIVVDQVTISSVNLPKDMANSMQTETTFETKQIEQIKVQEHQLLVQQNNNQEKRLNQDRSNQCRRFVEEAKKDRQALEFEIEEMKTRMEKTIAEIMMDTKMDVGRVSAEGKLEIAQKRNEITLMLTELETQASMEVEKIKAEANKQVAEIKAQTQVCIAQNKAEATRELADAESSVAKSLSSKRAFDVAKKRIKGLKNLSRNKSAVIGGESGDSIMQMMMVRESAKVLGISATSLL
jgi:regulator of protease activity HflC (stomatin/prohibitin superfamily)